MFRLRLFKRLVDNVMHCQTCGNVIRHTRPLSSFSFEQNNQRQQRQWNWSRSDNRHSRWRSNGLKYPIPIALAFGGFPFFGDDDVDTVFDEMSRMADQIHRSFGLSSSAFEDFYNDKGSKSHYSSAVWEYGPDGWKLVSSSDSPRRGQFSSANAEYDDSELVWKRDEGLLEAVMTGDVKQIRKLLKDKSSGLSPNARHRYGWAALHVAAANNRLEEAKSILQAKDADVNVREMFTNSHDTARRLRHDIRHVHADRQRFFPARVSSQGDSFAGRTPLHYAAEKGDIPMLELLLSHGADASVRDSRGRTPAALTDDERVKKLLQFHEKKAAAAAEERRISRRREYPLSKRLDDALVGQHEAKRALTQYVARKEIGWTDDDHPTVMLFLGSSGVGKTEAAKVLATYFGGPEEEPSEVVPPAAQTQHMDGGFFGMFTPQEQQQRRPTGRGMAKKQSNFIRIDMGEYQQQHEVSKLLGAPPGYVGHEAGSPLVNQLRDEPESIVLFDEIEKAHPDLLTVLLGLFDEGRLTDGKGNTIDCKKATFIMTSNLCTDLVRRRFNECRSSCTDRNSNKLSELVLTDSFKNTIVRKALKRHFRRDEFLGRVNDVIFFLPFTEDELCDITRRSMQQWAKKLHDKHDIRLTWNDDVLRLLADKGYQEHYGARSIMYAIERMVINELAHQFEKKLIKAGGSVTLSVSGTCENDTDNRRICIR